MSSPHRGERRSAATGRPRPSVLQLPLDHESRECWLSSIRGYRDGHYIYQVEFARSRARWCGEMAVPEQRLDLAARRAWHEHARSRPPGTPLQLPPGPHTLAHATFLDLLADLPDPTDPAHPGIYLRRMHVLFHGVRYPGHVCLLRSDPAIRRVIQWAEDRAGAVESVEEGKEGEEEGGEEGDGWSARDVHTVEFFGSAPRKGRKLNVEVWQLDGEDVLFQGKASVRRLETDDEGTRDVVIEVVIGAQKLFLAGELRERMRCGRFMVIEESEVGRAKTSNERR